MFGLGKKKKELEESGLPELPELPELPPLSKDFGFREKRDVFPLPSFPSSKTGEKISAEAVKQAISMPEEISYTESIEMPRTREIDERIPIRIKPMTREIKPYIKTEPVYVRIDKYQNSLINLQEVKKKILEIENLLREIRELKAREEAQLQGWETEIQDAKIKLDNIDKTIFQKLEE